MKTHKVDYQYFLSSCQNCHRLQAWNVQVKTTDSSAEVTCYFDNPECELVKKQGKREK